YPCTNPAKSRRYSGREGSSACRISPMCSAAAAAARGVASRGACPNRGCQSRWSWWACVAQPQTTSSARVARAPAIRSSSGSSQAGSTSTARPASYTTVLVVLIVAEVNTSTPGAGSIGAVIASASQLRAHIARNLASPDRARCSAWRAHGGRDTEPPATAPGGLSESPTRGLGFPYLILPYRRYECPRVLPNEPKWSVPSA